ncbi:MAG: C69 family dipeptidase [Bacteroidales bacterium]|nr:C69 family dipeptidase [Bacteroidales bacterium]
MKKVQYLILVALLAMSATVANACTNFLIGKKASADGSTMISYAADSYWLFGSLSHYPAAVHQPGVMRDVYEWDTNKYLGQIKEAERTYNVIGNINEYQVSIGETTYTGREELIDTTGIIDYGSLIYIALQRSRTAREAIRIMTDLVAEYGYYSSGESFSIADPNEIWIMEMIGKGPGNKGAVWVARLIPSDCVSAHANQARITTFPTEKTSKNSISSRHINRINDTTITVVYAEDVISFARSKGYYKGADKDFSFSDTYNPLDFGGIRFCEARVWSFFNKVSSDMKRYLPYINGESKERMPLWIKPNKKISVTDVKNYMRDHYENTPLDMTTGMGSGAWGSPYRNTPLTYKAKNGKEYYHERPVATQQTGFSFVAQMRDWLPNHVGGILWFGVDDATVSCYVPMYCGMNSVPECFSPDNGSLLDLSWTSAFWINNWLGTMVYARYSRLIPYVKAEQDKWDAYFLNEIKAIDERGRELIAVPDIRGIDQMITSFSCKQAEKATKAWKQMAEFLFVKYLDDAEKGTDEKGNFLRSNGNIPAKVIREGYPQDYIEKELVKPNPERFRLKTQKEMDNRK